MKFALRSAALFVVLSASLAATAAHAGTLTVEVTNVRNAKGTIHIDVCPQTTFLKDYCVLGASAPAHNGTVVLTLHDVPDGVYAVQAFHDENNNGKVDRGLFGIPREGIGFSNDAPIDFGPPSWKDAHIALAGNRTVRLKLRYMSGPPGPAGA